MQNEQSESPISDDDNIPPPIVKHLSDIPNLPITKETKSSPSENSISENIIEDVSVYITLKKFVNTLVRKRKTNVNNYIRTWNILDTKSESELIELENERKKISFKLAGLTSLFTVKSKSDNFFVNYKPIDILDNYEGIKIDFPLEMSNIMKVIEYIKAGKIIHSNYIMKVIHEVGKYYLYKPNIERIETKENHKITVVGDLHGQLQDLFTIFELNGLPCPNNIYIFNGDFVDRGKNGVEIFFIICCFKLLYKNSVYINRGNHESMSMNSIWGFRDEVYMKYPECKEVMYILFNEVFHTLPLVTLINERIFIVHGGIGGLMDVNLNDINEINRFRDIPCDKLNKENYIFECLLWSDPRPSKNFPDVMNEYFRPANRGAGFEWSYGLTLLFCQSNCINYIIRSHECVDEGYEVLHQGLVYTIFSASFYCNSSCNKGSYLNIDNSLRFHPQNYYSKTIDKSDISWKMKNQLENLKKDVIERIKELIITYKADLYEWYTQTDKAKSGYITKYEWAYSLYTITKFDIPFISYAKELVTIEENGKIKYCDFLDRYLLDVKGLDKSWYEDTLMKICKKLLLTCSSLTKAFEVFDKNGDGVIEYDEFESAIKALNIGLSKSQIYELMRYLDTERDNKINYREFTEKVKITFSSLKTSNRDDPWIQSSFSKIGEALFIKKTPLKEIFDEFDENNDNQLNEEEFIKSMKKLNLDFSDDDLIKIYNAIDVDSSGLLNYEEFTYAFQISLNDLIYGYRIPENLVLELYKRRRQLQSLFKYFDYNNEHKLKNDVFFYAIQSYSQYHYLPFTNDNINDMINYMDKDKDGFVDYNEFCNAFKVLDLEA